jgi:hypothetical protein
LSVYEEVLVSAMQHCGSDSADGSFGWNIRIRRRIKRMPRAAKIIV